MRRVAEWIWDEGYFYDSLNAPIPEELQFPLAQVLIARGDKRSLGQILDDLREDLEWKTYEFPELPTSFEFPIVLIAGTNIMGAIHETDGKYASVVFTDNDEEQDLVVPFEYLRLVDVLTVGHSTRDVDADE